MFKPLIAFVIVILLIACKPHVQENISTNLSLKIAFGSCSDQKIQTQMWSAIADQNPDLFILTGDIIYADKLSLSEMKDAYNLQKSNTDYQRLLNTTKIIGIWDDHDYGVNDGGKNNNRKSLNKELLLDFLDVPQNDSLRKHEGVYFSHYTKHTDKTVKFIFLDTRYFRDTLLTDSTSSMRYFKNKNGDILGPEQWNWLKRELKNSYADLNFLISGIQILPEEQAYEKWANFPTSRNKLLNLIQTIKPKNLIFLSGDRHFAEISKIELPELKYPLFELTSSGLTHTYQGPSVDINKYRINNVINKRNYGLLTIDFEDDIPNLIYEVKGHADSVFLKYNIPLQ